MTKKVLNRIEKTGVIAVIRLSSIEKIDEIVEALIKGGLSAIEITMTTPRALDLVSEFSEKNVDSAVFGVGTARNRSDAEEAIQAGAQFVISPILDFDIIEVCKENDVVVCPGAFSPTEIASAWDAGADIVKVFPTAVVGSAYIKAIKAPLPDIKLMPTGGVTVENCSEFIRNGASAIAVGSNLVNPKWIENGDFFAISEKAKAYMKAVKEGRRSLEQE